MKTIDNSGSRLTRREILAGAPTALLALGTLGSVSRRALGAAAVEGVHEIENTWITMPDGVKLAARIWLPKDAQRRPVPAILNYCPYYARLFTRSEDDARFPYYAAHGYACVRVDIRGSGDSQGKPQDEYVRQEQDDGVEIIKWIASQAWCTGSVGMEGISWSGFNSLQVAARRPPALKAIITHCSTDDRYRDDAHYKGGCIIDDMFDWGTVFLAFQGQAPDPAITGSPDWRRSWLERLSQVDFNLAHWLEHPHRDAFWKHASVIEDYGQITCPVYAIGGWVDAYKNAVFRLLQGLTVPRKGLVGPWTHIYPHQGAPGPAIGYLDEALRWWDHWLKGTDTGIMREPMLRVWMQKESAAAGVKEVPGYWAGEESWPAARIREQIYFLNCAAALGIERSAQTAVSLDPVQTVGVVSGKWCPSGAGGVEDLDTQLPLDQRLDDARSLVFDSAPLQHPLEILGACTLALEISVDRPVAFVAVRLNEVKPTGESTRVTYGVLNLCHRDSDSEPTALVPGQRYRVKLALDYIAHQFQPGNRLRVSISSTYWPLILPAPEPVRMTLYTGASSLSLPIRPTRPQDAELHPFGPPYVPQVPVQEVSSGRGIHVTEWDAIKKRQTIRQAVGDSVTLVTPINTRLLWKADVTSEIGELDVDGSIATRYVIGWERDRMRPRVEATSRISMTPGDLVVEGELTAFDGEEKVFAKKWQRRIPRKLV
ncbi:MAG TPA: CocE/NonD family hydrolase [Steroidobacteraceae bacterium]|nr:CocE/NonD family hydrolase [Steroidobacteraceae bacterium]